MKNNILKSTKSVFHNKQYPIEGALSLAKLLSIFIQDCQFKPGQLISLLVQIRTANDINYTLGPRTALNVSSSEDLDSYLATLHDYFNRLDTHYKSVVSVAVNFNYSLLTEERYSIMISRTEANKIKLVKEDSVIMPNELPLNFHYNSWGNLIESVSYAVRTIKNIVFNHLQALFFEVTETGPKGRIVKVFNEQYGKLLYVFFDNITGPNDFNRTIDNKTYYIRDEGVYFYFEKLASSKFMNKLLPAKEFNVSNILTLDVETYKDLDGMFYIYAICIGYENKVKSFYLTDYNLDASKLIMAALKELLSRKNTGKTVYIHNSSSFDLVFLLKHIVEYPHVEVNPIIKDGKFINVEIKYGSAIRYKLNLRDSLLLLPASLDELSKQFNGKSIKGIFPYAYVSKHNLDYVGRVPVYEYFDQSKVSLDDYNSYVGSSFKDSKWDLRAETIKYCTQDCKALYQVIKEFGNLIYDKFGVNILTAPTLPSVAFKIFRTKFFPSTKSFRIPVLTETIYDDLKNAYYGGHCDLYKPTSPEGQKVYINDVNALYPHAMKENNYPVNLFAYFVGDILKMPEYSNFVSQYLGVFKVKVTAPKGIQHPI